MPSKLIRKSKILAPGASVTAPDGPSAAGACAHCGDSLADLKVVQRALGPAMHLYCCHGCAFIAEQLFLAQASARDRQALGDALGPTPAMAPLGMATATQIPVRGMVCAACALLIEHRLRRVSGVRQAHVDFGGQLAYVKFDDKATSRAALTQAIAEAGYRTESGAAEDARAARRDLARLGVAWLMMMQVMMLAVPAYLAAPGDIPEDIAQLMRIAGLVLTLPVVLFSAQPLYRAAASQLRVGAIGMDLPVVLGLGAAFIASAVATVIGRGPVYFDSVTMFVALVLGSRWLLMRGLVSAREHIESARRGVRLIAQRLVAFPSSLATESIAAELLKVGDRVLVPAGETVPADGVVVHGRSSASQAWLTGESTPIEKSAGAPLLAGSINLDQPLVVEVTRRGEATSLAALQRLVDDAGRERPRIVELANRVAIVFLWVVLAVAALTAVVWAFIDPSQALPNAIAVLVASCPCALALAAPSAFAAGQSALAERRILLARSAALETLAEVDLLACDKTGTLTTGEPALLRQLVLRDAEPDQLLGVAAALESLSTHPYARALVLAAQVLPVTIPPLTEGRVEASAGIEGLVEARRYRIGKIDFALPERLAGARGAVAEIIARESLASASYVVLADEDGPVAVFIFGERLREDALDMVDAAAERGIETVVLSGDRREPVQGVAAALGVERALAHQTPESKRSWVAGQQRAGHRVAMVGDGMNDAPVIAQADVSIALATGSSLAQARADLIVLSSRLADVEFAFAVAHRALGIVRQNLVWALAYNTVALPLAAAGWLSPAGAAAGMAVSSLVVIANALRAKRLARRVAVH